MTLSSDGDLTKGSFGQVGLSWHCGSPAWRSLLSPATAFLGMRRTATRRSRRCSRLGQPRNFRSVSSQCSEATRISTSVGGTGRMWTRRTRLEERRSWWRPALPCLRLLGPPSAARMLDRLGTAKPSPNRRWGGRLLLAAGADRTIRDNSGLTALEHAEIRQQACAQRNAVPRCAATMLDPRQQCSRPPNTMS